MARYEASVCRGFAAGNEDTTAVLAGRESDTGARRRRGRAWRRRTTRGDPRVVVAHVFRGVAVANRGIGAGLGAAASEGTLVDGYAIGIRNA